MSDSLFRRIRLYQTTMSAMRSLLNNGMISPEEYAIIDTKIAQKYDLDLSIIYR